MQNYVAAALLVLMCRFSYSNITCIQFRAVMEIHMCVLQHVQNNTLQGTAARRRAVAATCSAASMTLMNLL